MSMPDNEFIVSILRTQAWERAKGALNEVLMTYHSEDSRFPEIDEFIHTFIRNVEQQGLQE